jgi:hypothetical protein
MQSIPFKVLAVAGLAALIRIIGCGVFAWVQWAALAADYPFVVDTLRIFVPLLIVVLVAWYAVGAAIVLWQRYGWRESIAAHYAILMKRAETQVAPLAQQR